MVGLTGSYDAVKAACKAYRVYFSTPPNTKPGMYLLSALFGLIAYETIVSRGRLPR
jgi:cytochrome oxidase Cu insertion factor (SCO1/SenC/PrrC family)